MEMLIGMGFILCMLYLFYEREGRSKTRASTTRAGSRRSTAKGRRTTKRRSTKKQFAVPALVTH